MRLEPLPSGDQPVNNAPRIGDDIADTHSSVQDYYGQQLQSSADLKTSACCDLARMPGWL